MCYRRKDWGNFSLTRKVGLRYEAIFTSQHPNLDILFDTEIPPETKGDAIHQIAQVALRCHMGQATEMSAVGFDHLVSVEPKTKVEIFAIAEGNHRFLVIGRAPTSKDPNDIASWGPNAVVCDPWAGKSYPASQIPSQLQSLGSQDIQDGLPCTETTPFDPVRQQLVVLASS